MNKTIFDYINSALFTKAGTLSNVDDETVFNMYMLNRWCSMYSPDVATVINDTTNRYYRVFDKKPEQFAFCMAIFPRVKFKKITYIKKAKAEKLSKTSKDQDLTLEHFARSREISIREAEFLLKSVEDLTPATKV